MAHSTLPRKRGKKLKKANPRQDVPGQAAAAQKNREREARLCIIEAFGRLGIPYAQWPDFVQAFYTDPHQRTEYHQIMTPPPFQAPDFDRLNQSAQEWAKLADRDWKNHRDTFLKECEEWVREGLDEEIIPMKSARGAGHRTQLGGRRRGGNTSINRRYEWAARYLVNVPLKEIAGADADVSTVGRIAREIIQLAGWPIQGSH